MPTTINVELADDRVAPATVVGRDPDTDLALLSIKLKNLPVMPLGRSDQLQVGDVVLAIGDPLGLSQTVTHGIVSATGRSSSASRRSRISFRPMPRSMPATPAAR